MPAPFTSVPALSYFHSGYNIICEKVHYDYRCYFLQGKIGFGTIISLVVLQRSEIFLEHGYNECDSVALSQMTILISANVVNGPDCSRYGSDDKSPKGSSGGEAGLVVISEARYAESRNDRFLHQYLEVINESSRFYGSRMYWAYARCVYSR